MVYLSDIPYEGRFKYYENGPIWIKYRTLFGVPINKFGTITENRFEVACDCDERSPDFQFSGDQLVYKVKDEVMHEYQKLNIGPAIELGDVRLDQEFVFFDNKQKKYKIVDRSKYERRAVKGGGFLIFVRCEGEAEQFAQSEDKVHVVLPPPPKPKLTLGDLKEGEQFQFKGYKSNIGDRVATKLGWFDEGSCCLKVLDPIFPTNVPIRVGDKLIFSQAHHEVERYVPF